MLLHLYVDYTRSAELRERFRRNPDLVLDWYEISEEERAALRSGGYAEYVRRAHQQLDELLSANDQLTGNTDVWPWDDQPGHKIDFTPDEGPIKTDLHITIRTRAHSVEFQEGVTVKFVKGSKVVEAKRVTISDVDPRTLEAVVKLHEAGEYYVVALQPDETRLSSEKTFTALDE